MSNTSERTIAIMVRITPKGDKSIIANKGIWSKAEYVRQALILAQKHNLRGPKEMEI